MLTFRKDIIPKWEENTFFPGHMFLKIAMIVVYKNKSTTNNNKEVLILFVLMWIHDIAPETYTTCPLSM